MQFGYTIIYVPDVAASLAFFTRAFGLARRFLHESGTYGELETGQPPWRLRHTNSGRRIFLEGMWRRTVRRSLWVWRSRWSRQMCFHAPARCRSRRV